jgi:hypothetical protein
MRSKQDRTILGRADTKVLTGLEPVIVNAATSGARRAAGWGTRQVIASRRATKLRKLVKEIEDQTEAPDRAATLSADETASIGDFLLSPCFVNISYSLACALIVEKSGRKADVALKAVKEVLSASLASAASEQASQLFTDCIFAALLYASTRATADLIAQQQSPRTQAEALKIIASVTAASTRNIQLLRTPVETSSFLAYENELRAQVRSLHGTMRIPHAGTARQVPYDKLFIPPRLQFAGASHQGAGSYGVKLEDLLRYSTRSVILGDPGGGKSTLALKLGYDIASDLVPSVSARLPFLVVLREYAQDNRGPNRISVLEYLETLSRVPYAVNPPDGAIEYLLLNNRALVIFDGLDELTDTSLRREIVQAVEGFAYRYPTTQIVVTSRRVGYEEAPLDADLFPALQLMELTDQQVSSYARKWFALDESPSATDQERLADGFLKDSAYVADLRVNPLLLSLMCGIYATENYIPRNRPDVYEKCALLLFDRWDKQRGIQVQLSFDAHVYAAMRSLALHMYSQEQQQLSRTELIYYIKSYLLNKRFDDPDVAEAAAEEFIDFCKGRAWVLTDVGEERYGFTHRTFLEYFSASQLVRLNPGAEPLFNTLQNRLCTREWDTVAQLAVQILGRSVEDGADDFLSLTVSSGLAAAPKAKANLMSFAARALQFIVPRPEVLRAIVTASIQLLTDADVDQHGYDRRRIGLRPSAQAATNLLAVAPELREDVGRLARDAITTMLEENWRQEQLLAYAFAPWMLVDSAFEEGIRVDVKYMMDWAMENSRHLSPIITRAASKYYWLDLMRASQGYISVEEVLRRHGPKALYEYNVAGYGPYPPVAYELLTSAAGRRNLWMVTDWHSNTVKDLITGLRDLLPAMKTPWFRYLQRYAVLAEALGWRTRSIVALSDQLALLLSAPLVEILLTTRKVSPEEPLFEGLIMHKEDRRNRRDWNRIQTILALRNRADVTEEEASSALAQVNLSHEAEELLRRWILRKVDFVAPGRARARTGESSG